MKYNLMMLNNKINTYVRCVAFGALLCFSTFLSAADSFQNHKSIYKVVEKFMHDHIASIHNDKTEISIGKLDSRLKLNKCNKSLRAFLPKGSRITGKTTVGVKCTGEKPWSLHIPVTISVYKKVLVTARTLQKGEVLSESDIKLIRHDISRLSYGYFENIKTSTGMKVKRHILADTVLTPAMLKKPQVITRGQKISILAHSGRMQVRMMGKALNNGAIGDRIKVMNMKSRQKIEGVITSAAEVKVDI